ncbi:MAG: glutamate ABC transporter substrate-binding protein [Acidimicrobiales bacterium]
MRSVRSSRRWAATVLVLSAALLAAACGSSSKKASTTSTTGAPSTSVPTFAPGTTMAAIQAKGKLVVGTKFDQPGFGQKNPTTGKVEGFDVEIAKLVAVGIFGGTTDSVEPKIDFQEAVSKNREPFIQNGTVDMVVATYTINDTRKQVVDFAGPYFIAHQDVMVKADDSSIKSVADLNGKKVCSGQGSTSATNLQAKAPQAQLTLFGTYSECAAALNDGRVVAVSTDAPILSGLVQQSQGAFKLVKAPFTDEPYGIGLKKGDDAFRNFINDRLEQIYSNGDWAKAFAATLGKLGLETPTPPPVDRYASAGASPSTSAGPGTSTSTTSASNPSSTSSDSVPPTTIRRSRRG